MNTMNIIARLKLKGIDGISPRLICTQCTFVGGVLLKDTSCLSNMIARLKLKGIDGISRL